MYKRKKINTKVILFLVMTLVLSMSYVVMAKEKYNAAQGIVISVDEASRKVTILPVGKPNRPENYIILTVTPNAAITFSQEQKPAPFAALRPGVVVKVSYTTVSTPNTPNQGMVNYITIQGSKKGKTFTTTPPPVVTETPEVTTTQPQVTEAPEVTTTQPQVTEAPEVTTTHPEVTEAPEVTTTHPEVTEAPEVTTTQPEVTQTPEVTTTQPEVTEAPEVTTTQPEVTEAPQVTTPQPVKKKTSPQIVKEYTIKDVCIIKVCKNAKTIIVAPRDATSDKSQHIIVHVNDDTKIIRLKGNKMCKFKHLRRGQKLNILTDGIIISSSPRETTAVGIMILNR